MAAKLEAADDKWGHLLYAWGTPGDFPGSLWGVHGMSVEEAICAWPE